MSKIWGQTPITNADKRAQTQTKYLAPSEHGGFEERIDRRPLGKVERFVDAAGHVVSLQIHGDGDPKRLETEQRNRMSFYAKGHIEHSKCPLRHGGNHKSPIHEKDFSKMPASLQAPCPSDPKVMERRDGDLYAKTGCPHIEWLITHRKAQAADALLKRNSHLAEAKAKEERRVQLEALQKELLEKQIAEMQSKHPVSKKAKDSVIE